jgi:hypothetical protein
MSVIIFHALCMKRGHEAILLCYSDTAYRLALPTRPMRSLAHRTIIGQGGLVARIACLAAEAFG